MPSFCTYPFHIPLHPHFDDKILLYSTITGFQLKTNTVYLNQCDLFWGNATLIGSSAISCNRTLGYIWQTWRIPQRTQISILFLLRHNLTYTSRPLHSAKILSVRPQKPSAILISVQPTATFLATITLKLSDFRHMRVRAI